MTAHRYITKLIWNISQQNCCINSFTDSECIAISSGRLAHAPDRTPKRAQAPLRKFRFGFVSLGAGGNLGRRRRGDRTAADGTLALLFDGSLRTRVLLRGKPLTPFQPSEALLLDGPGDRCLRFRRPHAHEDLKDPRHGAGRRHVITGRSREGIEKRVEVTFFEQLPGLAVLQVHYRNNGQAALEVAGWRSAAHELADAPGGFWSFSGATHEDRRDWVQPMKAGFDQRNTLEHGRVRLRRRHSDGQHLAPRRGPGGGPPRADAAAARPARAQDARRARASPSRARSP